MKTVRVAVEVTEDYGRRLKERLEEYDIAPSELAAACEPVMNPSMLSRWFHSDPPMIPSTRNIIRIEAAIVKLRAKKRKMRRRKKQPDRLSA